MTDLEKVRAKLAELRAVEKAASPAPWRAKLDSGDRCGGISVRHNHPPEVMCWDADGCPQPDEIVTTDSGFYGPTKPDARVIVEGRNALPALLAVADAAFALHHGSEPGESGRFFPERVASQELFEALELALEALGHE